MSASSKETWQVAVVAGLLLVMFVVLRANICYCLDSVESTENLVLAAKQYVDNIKTIRFLAILDSVSTTNDPRLSGNEIKEHSQISVILDFINHQGTIQSVNEKGNIAEFLFAKSMNFRYISMLEKETSIVFVPSLNAVSDEEKRGYPLGLFGNSMNPYFFGMWNSLESGCVSVYDVLQRNGKISVTQDKSTHSIKIHSASQKETIEIELDSSRGMVLRGFTYKNLDSSQKNRRIDIKYTVSEFIEKRGIFFPLVFDIESYGILEQQTLVPEKNKVVLVPYWYRENATFRLSDVDINFDISPDSIDFISKIADLTEVKVRDVPQIQYVWVDGKVKPLTDELAEERLRGVKFIPGVADSRFWLMFVGFVLFAFALAKLVWNYFKNKNNKGDDDDDNE